MKNVSLIKYTIPDNYKPVPVRVVPQHKCGLSSVKLMIQYAINPLFKKTPLKDLTFLVTPIVKDENSSTLQIERVKMQPKGKWENQMLEWKFSEAYPNVQDQQPYKLLAEFYPSGTITPQTSAAINVNVKFSCKGFTFAGIKVDGCDGKKSSISDQVFLGGLRQQLTVGNFCLK